MLDLSGQKFGRLLALRDTGELDKFHNRIWKWKCDCGVIIDRVAGPIKQGKVVSCGCYHIEQSRSRKKHGMHLTRVYNIWTQMKARINGNDRSVIKHYKDRGIDIDPMWKNSFDQFYKDMGDCPEGMSIDRIDNNKGYWKDNCRWATQREQLANTRRTVYIRYKDVPTCLKHACEEAGINYDKVRGRIRRGRTPQESFDRG